MGLLTRSSPNTKKNQSTSSIMRWVILVSRPGMIAQTYFIGWGNIHNVRICSMTGVRSEGPILALSKRGIGI